MYAVDTVSHSSVEVRSLKSRILVRNNKRLLQICAAVRGRRNNQMKKKFADCAYLVRGKAVAGVSLDAAHKLWPGFRKQHTGNINLSWVCGWSSQRTLTCRHDPRLGCWKERHIWGPPGGDLPAWCRCWGSQSGSPVCPGPAQSLLGEHFTFITDQRAAFLPNNEVTFTKRLIN